MLLDSLARPDRWISLLEQKQVPPGHCARLVSNEPFDLAALTKSRSLQESVSVDFAPSPAAPAVEDPQLETHSIGTSNRWQ